jgi:hypothetical protein
MDLKQVHANFYTAGEPIVLTPQRLRRVTNEAEEGSPAVSNFYDSYRSGLDIGHYKQLQTYALFWQVRAGLAIWLLAKVLLPFCLGEVAGQARLSLYDQVFRSPEP